MTYFKRVTVTKLWHERSLKEKLLFWKPVKAIRLEIVEAKEDADFDVSLSIGSNLFDTRCYDYKIDQGVITFTEKDS